MYQHPLCDQCHQAASTFHYTFLVNGKKGCRDLCAECNESSLLGKSCDATPPVVFMAETIRVDELAGQLGAKPFELVTALMETGVQASLGTTLTLKQAEFLGLKFGVQVLRSV